jgi:1-acyl-sn-glycerol-3-phosphate acyltransferase
MIRPILSILHPIYLVWAYLTFVVGLLLVFPFVLIAIPFGQPAAGNLVIKLCRTWSDAWLFCIGIRHQNIEESAISPHKHYVFVANHISYLDIVLIFQVIRKNSIRILGKMEMSKIPVFGVLYRLAVVLIDRSSQTSRRKSIQRLLEVLNQNISIFIFPEGTFNETGHPLKDFYDGAFKIAIETQTPIKPIVFLDAVERFHHKSIFSINPGKSRCVILAEIPVEGYTSHDVGTLKNATFEAMKACIEKYGGHYT